MDAGIGRPSQACEAMEMGAAAIMANTALATAGDLPLMASAFRQAIEAGRQAYLSGLGRVLTRGASRIRSAYRISAGLRGRGTWKIQFFVDSQYLSPAALEKKHRLETDPVQPQRTTWNICLGMEQIQSDVLRAGDGSGEQSYDYC